MVRSNVGRFVWFKQGADPLWSIRLCSERDRKLESRKLRREVRDGGSAAQGKVRGCMKGEKTGGAFACRMADGGRQGSPAEGSGKAFPNSRNLEADPVDQL